MIVREKKSRLQKPILPSHKNYTTIFRRKPVVCILERATHLHAFDKPTVINFNFKHTRVLVPLYAWFVLP